MIRLCKRDKGGRLRQSSGVGRSCRSTDPVVIYSTDNKKPCLAGFDVATNRGANPMTWETPTFVEVKMDAEINSYQDDSGEDREPGF